MLSADKVLTVREGDATAVSGQATAYDADSADQADGALSYGLQVPTDAHGSPLHHAKLNADGSITNDFGTFRVDRNGMYSFELNNESEAVRALTSGSLTETSVILDGDGRPEQSNHPEHQGIHYRRQYRAGPCPLIWTPTPPTARWWKTARTARIRCPARSLSAMWTAR